MSIRHTAKARRGAAAVAFAAGFALAVAGCGGGDEGQPEGNPSERSASADKPTSEAEGEGSEDSKTTEPIAELGGENGMQLFIHSVNRDAGGFVTVNGAVKNTGDKGYFDTPAWRGNEKELVSNGYSLGGAALVDQKGKKRYYVLRDTEGRCLCTTGITKVEPGEQIPVFVQFPAPPEGTTEVEFSLPTFDSATVEITE
ncbi:hypothetical protein [Streptomyces xinghaiensis]|uniref:hypothetical protein n=1 Tax=Streptomyces xinghaiensis TaxID=1038928 RepID=UPI0002F5D3E4|nr:hypothetical protein [Streptomyces xinghaiensis]MZE78105.1 hypothetical protein [Streptomyces sp. SID5475]